MSPTEAPHPATFISYAREDSEFAMSLVEQLLQAGVPAWIDQLDIQAGENWDDAVQAALAGCARVVVILSPDSVASPHVKNEYSYALGKGKTVIPALYRDCEIPFRLDRLNRVEVRSDTTNLLRLLTLGGKLAPQVWLPESWLRRHPLLTACIEVVALGLVIALWTASPSKEAARSTVTPATITTLRSTEPEKPQEHEPNVDKTPQTQRARLTAAIPKANAAQQWNWSVSNLAVDKSTIAITNTGSQNLCANTYLFASSGEAIACCSCLVTPNSLMSYSVDADLIGSIFYPGVPTSITVKLIASKPVGIHPERRGGNCDASSARLSDVSTGMQARGTTLHQNPTVPVTYSRTEVEFSSAPIGQQDLATLKNTCRMIKTNGNGFGICKPCRTGGL